MNINLSRRQMIIIGAVVLLLIIIIFVLLAINKQTEPTDEFVPEIFDSANVDSQSTTKKVKEVDDESATVMSVARNFVARYLSYSNDNWGENLLPLQSEMTEGMQQISAQDLLMLKSKYSTDKFYGVSAKVLSQSVISEFAGDYSLQLSVQLKETIGSVDEINYVKYMIDMVKSGDTWLVDNIYISE